MADGEERIKRAEGLAVAHNHIYPSIFVHHTLAHNSAPILSSRVAG